MRSAGVTLVELLVSIALSSLTFVAALQLVGASLGSSADMAAWSNIHDKASHAMLLLKESVARAGYLGCGGRGIAVHSLLRSELSAVPELSLLRPYAVHHVGANALQSLSAQHLPTAARAIDGRFGINVARLLPGNDLLVLRGLAYQALPLRVQTSAGGHIEVADRRGIVAGDFVAVTDCQHLELFRITSVAERSDHSLLARSAGLRPHDNHASRLAASRMFAVSPVSRPRLHKVESEFFFVAPSAGAPDMPALWRKETHRRPVEVIAGIGNLGVDEIADSGGHVLGIRIRFDARSARQLRGKSIERTYVRHFAFENGL
ncbi:MAG: hypothetical protein OXF72_09875 [Gammaproteobacteria bacterium]|nr:hypothetical protein [Gammaproteobacteria bacterium]MCY4199999.1 hypothetical protein [Gammaproteobacteria bacterium]MCY4323725.1 hypothetical protein [Gammaproteobacteria bacterium]